MITTDEIEVEKEYLKNVCRILAEEIEKIGAKKVELNELMSESDVVSIHAPSIPATVSDTP